MTAVLRSALADEMQCAARALAALAEGERLDRALEAAGRTVALAPASLPVVRDLAYGASRQLGLCRALADCLNTRPPSPPVAALQWLALSQLIDPVRHPATIVDQAVRAAQADPQTRFAAGFLNATLRSFLRRSAELLERARRDEQARWNHPRWWIDRLRADHPSDWQRILELADQQPPFTLRINRRRTDLASYQAMLQAQSMTARVVGESALIVDPPCPVHRLPGWAEGLVSVQDEGAQRAAHLLDVHDGQRVLDACSAPGGKSAHLLELASIRLTALELAPERLARVRDGLERLGLSAELVCGDAARPEGWWDGVRYDRILVDAPCSASGIVRRAPDARWLRRRGDLATFARTQRSILEGLWPLLEAGGKLLYATCSVFEAEGRGVVRPFLKDHADALERSLPADAESAARSAPRGPGIQLLPQSSPTRDHDGFFYCLIEKIRTP